MSECLHALSKEKAAKAVVKPAFLGLVEQKPHKRGLYSRTVELRIGIK
jgi:hypothetical protein